jgi:hypothetical protein
MYRLTSEQQVIVAQAREIAEKIIGPQADKTDSEGRAVQDKAAMSARRRNWNASLLARNAPCLKRARGWILCWAWCCRSFNCARPP